jgi:hypothetical protein
LDESTSGLFSPLEAFSNPQTLGGITFSQNVCPGVFICRKGTWETSGFAQKRLFRCEPFCSGESILCCEGLSKAALKIALILNWFFFVHSGEHVFYDLSMNLCSPNLPVAVTGGHDYPYIFHLEVLIPFRANILPSWIQIKGLTRASPV